MGYGADFWGVGQAMDPSRLSLQGGTYAYTSWRDMGTERASRGDASLVHSVGCRGWLPGLFPTTEADGAGWWMQLSREGSMGFCLGAARVQMTVGGSAETQGLVDTIVEAVREHRNSSALPFEGVHADVACRREGNAAQICKCESFDLFDCGVASACSTGELSSSACAVGMSSPVFWDELDALCSRCEGEETRGGLDLAASAFTASAFLAPTPAPIAGPATGKR